MQPSTLETLRDILAEAEFLAAQSAATSFASFRRDEVMKRAFAQSVEIMREAAKGLGSIPLDLLIPVSPSIDRVGVLGLTLGGIPRGVVEQPMPWEFRKRVRLFGPTKLREVSELEVDPLRTDCLFGCI